MRNMRKFQHAHNQTRDNFKVIRPKAQRIDFHRSALLIVVDIHTSYSLNPKRAMT